MADIVTVPKRVRIEDFIPNYEFQLQDVQIDTLESEKQKQYLTMFIGENFEVLEELSSNVPLANRYSYLQGAKDMLAFINLWIDSLNVLEAENV